MTLHQSLYVPRHDAAAARAVGRRSTRRLITEQEARALLCGAVLRLRRSFVYKHNVTANREWYLAACSPVPVYAAAFKQRLPSADSHRRVEIF